MTADIRKILVIRGANIGDLLCTTPLFTTLRQHFPDARIDALVNSYNAPVVINNPDLNHVFYYTKAKHRDAGESVLQVHWRRLRLLYQLRRQRYDVIILANCGYLHRPLRLAKLIGGQRVIGFVPDDQPDNIITDRVPYGDVHAHEVIKIHRLLAPLGIHDVPPALTLVPDASARRNAKKALEAAFPPPDQRPILAVHISARLPSQRWPVAAFIQLIQTLHIHWQGRFMLFWSPGDEDNPHHPGDDRKANEIIAACAGIPLLPYPTQHLQDLIAGLSVCQGMFCADGGAMHVGAAVRLPVVAMFGEAPANNWFPWGVPYIVLQPESRNVADVTPAQAFEACIKLLPGPALA